MLSVDTKQEIFDKIKKDIPNNYAVCGVKGLSYKELNLATMLQEAGHDNGLSIIESNGNAIVSIECERLDKTKHSNGCSFVNNNLPVIDRKDFFPPIGLQLAYSYCALQIKERIGIVGKHLDNPIAHDIIFNCSSHPVMEFQIRHHDAHACGAYYSSNFDECAILVIDAFGSYDHKLKASEEVSFYFASGNKIRCIDRFGSGIGGIGFLYFCASRLLGLTEGKLMGLSSYYDNKDTYGFLKSYNKKSGISLDIENWPKVAYHNRKTGLDLKKWNEFLQILGNHLGVNNIKRPEMAMTEAYIKVAGKIQNEIENAIFELAYRLQKLTNASNLAISGGVGLNVIANSNIREKLDYKNVFVQPACSDAGLALGNALFLHHMLLSRKRVKPVSVYLGREYKDYEWVESAKLLYPELEFKRFTTQHLNNIIAEYLSQLKIVAWFKGGCESGPRALGHRSILATPTSTKIRDKLNKIKGRELWRPLAPVLKEEEVSVFFNTQYTSPYMLFNAFAKEKAIKCLPGCIHVDKSARLQTVSKADKSSLYDLLDSFEKKVGIPCLIVDSNKKLKQPDVKIHK